MILKYSQVSVISNSIIYRSITANDHCHCVPVGDDGKICAHYEPHTFCRRQCPAEAAEGNFKFLRLAPSRVPDEIKNYCEYALTRECKTLDDLTRVYETYVSSDDI